MLVKKERQLPVPVRCARDAGQELRQVVARMSDAQGMLSDWQERPDGKVRDVQVRQAQGRVAKLAGPRQDRAGIVPGLTKKEVGGQMTFY